MLLFRERDINNSCKAIFNVFVSAPRPTFKKWQSLDGRVLINPLIRFAAIKVATTRMAILAGYLHLDTPLLPIKIQNNIQSQAIGFDTARLGVFTCVRAVGIILVACIDRINDGDITGKQVAGKKQEKHCQDGKQIEQRAAPRRDWSKA
jgi:hypothetical protein